MGVGRVPQSLLVASGGRAAVGKAEDESCGGVTAEDDNAARRRSECRAAERGIAGHALGTARGQVAGQFGHDPLWLNQDLGHSCYQRVLDKLGKRVRKDNGLLRRQSIE